MSGPFWTLCAAIGCLVVIFTLVSALLLVAGMCASAWRDRRTFVPRAWVEQEQRRRCDRRPPHSDLRHPSSFKDDER